MSNIGKLDLQLPQNIYSIYSRCNNSFYCIGRLGILEFAQNSNFCYIYNTNYNFLRITLKRANLSMQWGLIVATMKQVYCGIIKGYTQRLELFGLGFKCYTTG